MTYQFLPKANAVIFLLDANSPLKKTEIDFIVKKILPLKIKNILFLLNKYDCVDEEEEDELLEEVQYRLDKIFDNTELKKEDIKVYPISAKQALKGVEENNNILLDESNLKIVQEELTKMIFTGNVEQDKIRNYKNTLFNIIEKLEREFINTKNIKIASINELEKIMNNLDEMIKEKESNKKNINGYINQSKQKIYNMTKKSLRYFQTKIEEDIVDMIDTYKSDDFKDFIEKNITKRIKKNIEGWLGLYTPRIDILLKQIEQE